MAARGFLVGIIGVLLIALAFFAPQLLAVLIVDNTPPRVFATSPSSGSSQGPDIISAGLDYAFRVTAGDENIIVPQVTGGGLIVWCLSVGFSSGTLPQAAPDYCQTGVVSTNGGVNCLWDAVFLSGKCSGSGNLGSIGFGGKASPSSDCAGLAYCGFFLFHLVIPNALKGSYALLGATISDLAGNKVTVERWGFVDAPAGYMILQTGLGGSAARYAFCNTTVSFPCVGTAATIVTQSNLVFFIFNATQAASNVDLITILFQNGTAPTVTYLCYLGSSPLGPGGTVSGGSCRQTSSFSKATASSYVFPAFATIFSSGVYNVTAYFSCSGCTLQSYRVLSIVAGFGGESLPGSKPPFCLECGKLSSQQLLFFALGGILAIVGFWPGRLRRRS